MSKKFRVNDLIQINNYLDGRLTAAEMEQVNQHQAKDSEYQKAIREIAYTRLMLRALPQKRAPRNFTLAREKAGKPIRMPWLQPVFGFVSIASTAILVLAFGSGLLLNGPRAAAPAMEAFSAEQGNLLDEQATPMILNWFPERNSAGGMGGGGGPETSGVYTGGDGIGGAGGPGFITATPIPNPETIITEQPPLEMIAPETAIESPAAKTIDGGEDMSTLILGIPEEGTTGRIMETPIARLNLGLNMDLRTRVMLLSAAFALITGALALALRRR